MRGPGLLRERRPNFVTPPAAELSERCVTQSGASEASKSGSGETCFEVFVDLLFSDLTSVIIVGLVYAALYAVYHFHGR